MSAIATRTQTGTVSNFIAGERARGGCGGETLREALDPATGEPISARRALGRAADVAAAVAAARAAQPHGRGRTVAERGAILRQIAQLLERDQRGDRRRSSRAETGKAPEGGARRGRRRDRDGLLRRRRGPALLRPDDDQRGARTGRR